MNDALTNYNTSRYFCQGNNNSGVNDTVYQFYLNDLCISEHPPFDLCIYKRQRRFRNCTLLSKPCRQAYGHTRGVAPTTAKSSFTKVEEYVIIWVYGGMDMGLIPQTLSRSVERYGLGYIRPRHNEMARRLVAGQKPIDVQRTMDISESRFSIIINSPLFKVVLAKLSKLRDANAVDIQEELKELVPIALDQVAKTVMTSTSEKLRLDASKDILDRGGVVKKGQHAPVGVQINIHPVDLEKYRCDSKGNGDGVTIETQLADAEALECKDTTKDSFVQPVNTSKSNGDSEVAEESMKLLEEALREPVEETDNDAK